MFPFKAVAKAVGAIHSSKSALIGFLANKDV
jgi:hypothetical protein